MVSYSAKTVKLMTEIVASCTECNRCMRDCLFLQRYCNNPKGLFSGLMDEKEMSKELPYSCLLCGHCTFVCPEKLKIDEAFLSIRQDMVREKKGLPLKSLRHVSLHQKLSTSRFFSTVNQGGKSK